VCSNTPDRRSPRPEILEGEFRALLDRDIRVRLIVFGDELQRTAKDTASGVDLFDRQLSGLLLERSPDLPDACQVEETADPYRITFLSKRGDRHEHHRHQHARDGPGDHRRTGHQPARPAGITWMVHVLPSLLRRS
jgi:hypothetical protein